MSWYNEATFYHIYPLGLTGAPKENDYGTPVHRLNTLLPWIDHIKEIGCTALYIGPLFESVGHGYETTDYKKLDSRLGTNEDLTNFVKACHDKGIRVIFDGVFNHTGRDFFAFKDIQKNREKFAAYNLTLIEGKAPEALDTLPAPDAVFIGGTKGNMDAVIDAVLHKNPAARLCIAAIALETLSAAVAALTAHGLAAEVTQIAVSRTKTAGSLHLLMANNPVFLITGART